MSKRWRYLECLEIFGTEKRILTVYRSAKQLRFHCYNTQLFLTLRYVEPITYPLSVGRCGIVVLTVTQELSWNAMCCVLRRHICNIVPAIRGQERDSIFEQLVLSLGLFEYMLDGGCIGGRG